ncbi:hypothetical protein TIFTF001_036578 [Ficus carica]|uniref:MADS-box domain-containing protein n=1 Tax=Ficus carica TaxID=3494 RepID=A0AA88JB90_FICCA|nr:hypothetical protein TIFTF001_036578 [Ficus carica]
MPKRSFDTLIMAEEEAEAEGGGAGGGGSNSRKPNKLFVSFSKRHTGLFRKAFDICRLFDGAQVAVLVLSPTGNPFAFGHSSVDNVLHRYFLRQPTIPSTTYPLMITTTTATTMSDKHRHQAQLVETLKVRVKRAQNRDCSASLRDLKAWIDKAAESCKVVEELESLREKFLALLERVRSRLILRSFSSCGEEEKVVETKPTVVGPADSYVLDISSTGFDQCVGMQGKTAFFEGESSAADVRSLAAMGPSNDMSFRSMEEFGYSNCDSYCEMEVVSYEQRQLHGHPTPLEQLTLGSSSKPSKEPPSPSPTPPLNLATAQSEANELEVLNSLSPPMTEPSFVIGTTFAVILKLPSTSTITLLVRWQGGQPSRPRGRFFGGVGEDGVGDVGGVFGEAGEDGVVLGGVGVDGDGVEGVDGDGDVGVVRWCWWRC